MSKVDPAIIKIKITSTQTPGEWRGTVKIKQPIFDSNSATGPSFPSLALELAQWAEDRLTKDARDLLKKKQDDAATLAAALEWTPFADLDRRCQDRRCQDLIRWWRIQHQEAAAYSLQVFDWRWNDASSEWECRPTRTWLPYRLLTPSQQGEVFQQPRPMLCPTDQLECQYNRDLGWCIRTRTPDLET